MLGGWPEGYRPIPLAGKAEPCSTRHSPSPPVLQTLANVPSDSTGDNGRTGLYEQSSSDTGSKGGAILVGATPYQMEWSLPNAKRPRPDNNDGRLQYRLGCGMSGGEDRGSLVKDGSHSAHKLPGAAGSHAGGQMLSQEPTRYTDSFKDGQLDCPNVHKQAWGTVSPQLNPHQLQHYVSWRPDPGAMAIDAFNMNWTKFQGYANLSWNLIGRVLTQVREQRAQITLVAPTWKSQPWYPVLLGMLIREPLMLPRNHGTIILTHSVNQPHMTPQLAAWSVFGIDSAVKSFQRRLQGYSSHPGSRRQTSHMTHCSKSGCAGVIKGIFIPFQEI